jgi:hypothetical protein
MNRLYEIFKTPSGPSTGKALLNHTIFSPLKLVRQSLECELFVCKTLRLKNRARLTMQITFSRSPQIPIQWGVLLVTVHYPSTKVSSNYAGNCYEQYDMTWGGGLVLYKV